jgi:hypothetical protein
MSGLPAKSIPRLLALAMGAALFLGSSAARGDMWTNAAGQAVEATLLFLDGDNAVFKGPDGKRFVMPLASLSPAARQQALDASGRIEVPARLRPDFDLCANTLKRLGELRKAGQLGDDAEAEQRKAALDRLKLAFERFGVSEASRDQLLMRARNQ